MSAARSVTLEQADIDMVCLALAVLTIESPGFEYAVRLIAQKLGSDCPAMVAEFRRLRTVPQ